MHMSCKHSDAHGTAAVVEFENSQEMETQTIQDEFRSGGVHTRPSIGSKHSGEVAVDLRHDGIPLQLIVRPYVVLVVTDDNANLPYQ